jgi:phosphoglycolate phosphatase-like HAD superfamily hydrolase
MKVLALDFDGVIAESARESYLVAVRTYLAMRPASRLRARLAALVESSPAGHDFAHDPLFGGFKRLMPFGNRAEDYGVTLAILEEGVQVGDQRRYDAFFASQDDEFLRAYHRQFYEQRARFMCDDPETWLRFQPPYTELLEVLRRWSGCVRLAIVTAKDRASTRALLVAYGVSELFPESRLLDKETGVSKTAHLRELRRRSRCQFGDLTFVDDKVKHLEAAASLGVRCVLAAWGYNGEPERAEALRRGFLVCTLSDVGERLF